MKTKFAHTSAITAEHEFLLWIKITYPEVHLPMNPPKPPSASEPAEAQIQHAAYLLWIENGRPEGRDLEHWLAAKEMLCHRRGRDGKTRRGVPEYRLTALR